MESQTGCYGRPNSLIPIGWPPICQPNQSNGKTNNKVASFKAALQ